MINFEDIIERAKYIGIEGNTNLPLLDKTHIRNAKNVLERINILHIFYAISLEGEKSIPFFEKEIDKNQ
ncbi:MAG: hypothetical protein ACK5MD_06720 [Flavobacteriales bacterium]